MRFTPALAASFGDWLECDAIRRALLAELPDLAPTVELHPQRPLLRIPRAEGPVIVARVDEADTMPWVVGVVAAREPTLHEVETAEAAVELVLEILA
ncbi:MAG TPA: hypothetical protein K8U89_15280 [Brachybacterium faecium]|nr:hypothetical protein [Brachybacterium faecium]